MRTLVPNLRSSFSIPGSLFTTLYAYPWFTKNLNIIHYFLRKHYREFIRKKCFENTYSFQMFTSVSSSSIPSLPYPVRRENRRRHWKHPTNVSLLCKQNFKWVKLHSLAHLRILPNLCASCLLDPPWAEIWISTFASGRSNDVSATWNTNHIILWIFLWFSVKFHSMVNKF